jgi:hypothetical protein
MELLGFAKYAYDRDGIVGTGRQDTAPIQRMSAALSVECFQHKSGTIFAVVQSIQETRQFSV